MGSTTAFRFIRVGLMALAMLAAALPTSARAETNEILIFAAASLKNALDEIAASFAAQRSVKVVTSYAGTSALAKQIEAGAPADLFISADEAWMDHVAKAGLLREGSRRDVIGNTLVLIAPGNAAEPLGDWQNLPARLSDGRLAMADVKAVPAGKYGAAALRALGLWGQLSNRIVETADVRAALAPVARGEAPCGIVYASDAKSEPAISIIAEFPAASHPPIRYAAAQLAASNNNDAAGFLDFLSSAVGQAILVRHGFRPLDPP